LAEYCNWLRRSATVRSPSHAPILASIAALSSFACSQTQQHSHNNNDDVVNQVAISSRFSVWSENKNSSFLFDLDERALIVKIIAPSPLTKA
jgi:hypothetical protein